MILSSRQHVELKSLNDGMLIKQKYVSAYENEIKMFNQWQNLVFEIFKREKIKGEIRR